MLILTRKYFKQLMCLHHWRKGLPVDIQYGKGYKYCFDCTVCGKYIERWHEEEPISGIIPDPWAEYKKDPLHRMSPPIVKIDD